VFLLIQAPLIRKTGEAICFSLVVLHFEDHPQNLVVSDLIGWSPRFQTKKPRTLP
jgi:hypothetical protein